jgi:dTDP-glucose 4,6-dehydratase
MRVSVSTSSVEAVRAWRLDADLEAVAAANADLWPRLDGARFLITGGTGFIGRWLLETLRHARARFDVDIRATILTRSPEAFHAKAPHLFDDGAFEFLPGDVTDFVSPTGSFTHLIHAATEASAHLNETDPRQMFDTVLAGTRRALDLAVEKRVERLLFLSSGAVYGRQPWELERVPETWLGGPDCREPRDTYAEAKRAAEMLCAIYAKQFGVDVVTARIFALLGPFLSLDIHFAAGNFIRDAMAGRRIVVESSGEACRSYLYAADLAVWLWRLLGSASAGSVYNVGSEEWLSIADLARRTAGLLGGEVEIRGARDSGWNPGRYVPDTSLARGELGLAARVSLDEAIVRTASWNGWR